MSTVFNPSLPSNIESRTNIQSQIIQQQVLPPVQYPSQLGRTMATSKQTFRERLSQACLAVGSVLILLSLFLPWWSLNSSVVNGRDALFSFSIGPVGMAVNTIVGNPSALLAPLFFAVTILFIPISTSLFLGAFNGIYCLFRKRIGVRILIAPLWSTIAIVWWFTYFLLVYNFFGSLGLNIQPTGSASISWKSYQLVGANWGWDAGLWIAIAGCIVLFAAGLNSTLNLRAAQATALKPEMRFSFHSIGLLLLASVNLLLMIGLLALFSDVVALWLIAVPVTLLFIMALFARRPSSGPKALTTKLAPHYSPMTTARAPLLREPIGYRKAGGLVPLKGHLELYEDGVVLKLAPGIGTARVGIGQGENIPFTHITSLNAVNVKSLLSKKVQIELQTSLGVTWEISGDQRMYTALQSAYQAWKTKLQ